MQGWGKRWVCKVEECATRVSLAREGEDSVGKKKERNVCLITFDIPCSLTVLKRCGITRGTMSWDNGIHLDRASSLSLLFSLRSPAGKRYSVPLSPCARSARLSRRGRSQNVSAAW